METPEYFCLYGTEQKDTPAEDLYEQPTEERPDDGKVVQLSCDSCLSGVPHRECYRQSPVCADCGVGTLMWAEAGYVSYHRICSNCGSHWDLRLKEPNTGFYHRARFYRS